MDIDACFHLGHVIKPHGLKGEVSILLDVDHPQNYKELESVFIEINKKLVPFFIDTIKLKNDVAVVKFEDIDSAENLKNILGQDLYLPLELLPPLEGNHFYFHEVIGFVVVDDSLGQLGTISSIYTHPNQSLIAMDYRNTEILIPITDKILHSVNRKENTINVDLPEGLLDIYLD